MKGQILEFSSELQVKLKENIGCGSYSYVYSTSDQAFVVKAVNLSDPRASLAGFFLYFFFSYKIK